MSPDWVQSVLDGNQEESEDYMVLECAWGTVQDAAAYKEGHIKGAYHMNTDDIESEEYWNIRTPEEIKALMAEYGITKDTTVICYSDKGTNSADDRVAFTLLWAGVENVKCLDGGFEATRLRKLSIPRRPLTRSSAWKSRPILNTSCPLTR